MTTRLASFMDALQTTDRPYRAHLYFGNPYLAADAPYIKRVLMGYTSMKSVEHALKILTGEAVAEGVVPYDVKFRKPGEAVFK